MVLKDKAKTPKNGWRYFDPNLEMWVESSSFERLIQDVMLFRVNKGKQNHNFLSQMIEDQICDGLPQEECDGRGLGDVVHTIAKPIAKVLDSTLKTNLGACGGCAKRRAKLNS